MTTGASSRQDRMLGKLGQRILKTIHVASAGVWLGGLVAIVVLLLAGGDGPISVRQLGLDLGAHLVHDIVLFWAFVVTLTTGLAFATLTPWGMFRHDWITAKWLLAIGLFVAMLWFANPALAIVAGLSDAGADVAGGAALPRCAPNGHDPRGRTARGRGVRLRALDAQALEAARA